jgi:hypothetical protein
MSEAWVTPPPPHPPTWSAGHPGNPSEASKFCDHPPPGCGRWVGTHRSGLLCPRVSQIQRIDDPQYCNNVQGYFVRGQFITASYATGYTLTTDTSTCLHSSIGVSHFFSTLLWSLNAIIVGVLHSIAVNRTVFCLV